MAGGGTYGVLYTPVSNSRVGPNMFEIEWIARPERQCAEGAKRIKGRNRTIQQ